MPRPSQPEFHALSRRERQIMDILHRAGEATVAEVLAALPDPPSESAVRSALWLLVNKGHVRNEQRGPRNVYSPAGTERRARRSALEHLLGTFFRGSRAQAVTAILEARDTKLTDDEIGRIEELLGQMR